MSSSRSSTASVGHEDEDRESEVRHPSRVMFAATAETQVAVEVGGAPRTTVLDAITTGGYSPRTVLLKASMTPMCSRSDDDDVEQRRVVPGS